MSRTSKADWAALVPWEGIQGKPPFTYGPNGNITISDVQGLQAALDSKQSGGGLARVAYSGNYADLNNKPPFGSAAFADVDNFQLALTAKQLQTGEVTLVSGQQDYDVLFSVDMASVPKVYLQVLMADVGGEMFSAVLQEDVLTVTGFTLWLSGVPSLSTGKVRWRATTEMTPA